MRRRTEADCPLVALISTRPLLPPPLPVVVLKPQTPSTVLASHLSEVNASPSLADDAGVTNVYDSELMVGYAGKFDADTLALIRAQDEVDFVELDSVVTTQETELGAPWVCPVVFPCLWSSARGTSG